MAGGRTIQFGVTLDTSQAKAQARELQATLQNVSKVRFDTGNLDAQLERASTAAQELQMHLQAATDVNTGKINLVNFQNSLKASGSNLKLLLTQLQQAGPQGQAAFNQVTTAIASAQVPMRQLNGQLGQMWTTLKNTAKWQLSSSVIHGIIGAFSGAVSYAKQLDSALNDIRIVTGQTVDQMTQFTKQAQQAAATLSTTTKEYAKASLLYYQQGLGDDEVAKRTALTIKAANASFGSSAKEMSEYLTAVWNSYQAGSDQLQSYVDVMAALGASTASSMEEIATSLSKVASTANVVGVSMEQMSSIVSTVSSVTRQSAESVGTAYKTILARMADLKMGKTLEDDVGLGQVSSTLQNIGINILDATGELRDMGTVIEEIGAKWKTMSKAQQTALAEQMGGKRQYTQMIALFDNFEKYQKNLQTAKNSEGSLDKMAATYAESWEAASERVQNALQGIYNQLINGKEATKVLDGFKDILTFVGDMVESLGGLKGTLAAVGSIFTATFADKTVAAVSNMKTALTGLFIDPKKSVVNSLMSTSAALLTGNTQHLQSQDNAGNMAALRAKYIQQSPQLGQQNQQHFEQRFQQIQQEINLQRELEAAQKNTTAARQQSDAILASAIDHDTTANANLVAQINGTKELSQAYEDLNMAMSGKDFATSDLFKLENGLTQVSNAINDVKTSMDFLETSGQDILKDPEARTEQFELAITRMKDAAATLSPDLSAAFDTIDVSKITTTKELLDQVYATLKNFGKGEFSATGIETMLTKIDTIMTNLLKKMKDPNGQLAGTRANQQEQQREGAEQTGRSAGQQHIIGGLIRRTRKEQEELDQDPFTKITSGAMHAASALMAFNTAMSSVETLTSNAANGSLNFSNGLASIASTAMSTVMIISQTGQALKAFGVTSTAAMGWIGAAIALASIAIGVIQGLQKADAEKRAKEQENYLTSLQNTIQAENEAAITHNNLITSFLDSYSVYKSTGEVTDELSASAHKLAEHYADVYGEIYAINGEYDKLAQHNIALGTQTAQDDLNQAVEDYNNLVNNATGSQSYSSGIFDSGASVKLKPTSDNTALSVYDVNTGEKTVDVHWYGASHETSKQFFTGDNETKHTYHSIATYGVPEGESYTEGAQVTLAQSELEKLQDSPLWPYLILTSSGNGLNGTWRPDLTASIQIDTTALLESGHAAEVFDWIQENVTTKGTIGSGTTLGKGLRGLIPTEYIQEGNSLSAARETVATNIDTILQTRMALLDTITTAEEYEEWLNGTKDLVSPGFGVMGWNDDDWTRYADQTVLSHAPQGSFVHKHALQRLYKSTNPLENKVPEGLRTILETAAIENEALPLTGWSDSALAVMGANYLLNPEGFKLDDWAYLQENGLAEARTRANTGTTENKTYKPTETARTTQGRLNNLYTENIPNAYTMTSTERSAAVTAGVVSSYDNGFSAFQEAEDLARMQGEHDAAVLALGETQITTGRQLERTEPVEGAVGPAVQGTGVFYDEKISMTEAAQRTKKNLNLWSEIAKNVKVNPETHELEYTGSTPLTEQGLSYLQLMQQGYQESGNPDYFYSSLGSAETYRSLITDNYEQTLYDSTIPYRFLLSTNPTERQKELLAAGGTAFWDTNATRVSNSATNIANLTGVTALPTTLEGWTKLYPTIAQGTETLAEVMGLDASTVGTRMRAYAKAQQHQGIWTKEGKIRSDWANNAYLTQTDLETLMTEAGIVKPEDISDEDWRTKQAQFLYENGFMGEVISEAEAVARESQAQDILTNAFGLENADTINKLSQTQSLVSALISDITNLQQGKGLSGQTRSLLEMMGIDPDSIDTVAELKSTISNLLDPENENSLPAMRATLEASAKEYGIEDFSAITDEDIAAWSSADATPEQQRKLALYKQWLEYKQKEYELDQSMNEIEKQERSQKEQSKISKWKDELTQLNKEATKAKETYEALSSSIETGKLTKAQRQNLGTELAAAWDQATTAAQRAKVAMAAAYESTAKQQAALDQEAGAAEKFAGSQSSGVWADRLINGIYAMSYDTGAKKYKATWEDEASFIEKFFGSDLSGAETSVLSQAYQATLNIIPNWTEDPQAFITEFYNQLNILNNDYAEQSDTLMSQLADNINNMYANLGQQEQAAAQAAVQAWTNAFNTIKTVRQALFSDKSAMELIAASPEQAIAMWSQYAASTSGATTTGFLQAARTGKLTANTFQYGDTANYLAAARQQYGIDMVTWSQDGQTYYGRGADYHRSMGRVAEHLGMQYSTTGGNVTWNKGQNGQAGYFTVEGDDTHYSASDILTRAQSGDLKIGADQIGEYITPMWTSALQSTGNYSATEATALVMKAMGGDADAWAELTTALGTVDSGLQAFATAVKEAAEVTEHLTDAQTKAEKANREGGQAAKIADALLAFAQDTSGMSWAEFAAEQGLTQTQWESVNNGNVTRANAWSQANLQYGAANTSYGQATQTYNDYIQWLTDQGYGEDSAEMQAAIQARDQAAETEASNAGKQKQAARTKLEQMNARNQKIRDYRNEKYNTAAQATTLKNNYADFYSTGVLSPEAKQALLAAGIDPNSITSAADYKRVMSELRGNQAIYNANNKKNFASYARESGHGNVNFDNVTATTSYADWLTSLGVGSEDYIWAMNDSEVKSRFDTYQQGLVAAQTAQEGLSDSAIEMGVNIERAMAKANKEVDKLDKQYKDIAGLGEKLSASVKTGRLDPAAQAKLAMAGLSTAWGDAKTIQERAKVAARASALEATKQIDVEARRNQGITGQNGILQFFGKDANEANKATAETMAKTFKDNWTQALQDTGSSKEAIKNILAMDEFASLSEEAKAKIEEIFSDLNLSDTASPDEFWQAFLDAAEEAGVEAKQVIESITTNLLSSWQSAMTSIVAEEQAAAQEVVAIWQEAFAIISALHEAAFSGKTLREGLKSVDDYVNAWIQLGATDAEDFAQKLDTKGAAAQDLVAAISDPTLTRQATATAYSGLNAFVDWKDDKMVNAEGGAIADLASYKDIVASKVMEIISDKNNPEYAATMAKLGLTDNGDGTFSRTVTDSTGKETTVTFNGKESLIGAYTEHEWEQAFAAGQGAADEYYRTEMRRENARRLTAEATGGKLRTAEGEVTTVTLTDRSGKEISYSDLASLEKGYAAKWESSDAALLEKAIGFTKESDWLSTKEGGQLSEDEIARLKKMGVIDATGAGSTSRAIAAKDSYVADTTVLDQQREWVAAAVRGTLQATDHNTYLDTSRARVLGEGEKAGLGEGTYTAIVNGKEVTYAAPEILESDFEALTETLDATSEAAQNEIEALSPGVEDALNAAASALGVTRQELGETVEGIYALNNATLDWNNLSKEEQAHAATVAQEWQKQAEALDVLGKALTAKTGAFAIIEDETKSVKEQTAAYETLRDAVNNYFHDNEVGTEFVKQNYEDIKAWANGSLEAMERVEKAVLTQQLDKMLKKQGKAVKDFAKELEELNGIGNDLKFGEKLSKIDMAKLMKIQKALGLTNEEMIALADSMGLALDYEKEMTGQELVDSMGIEQAAQYAADQGMQLAFDETSQQYVLINVDADTSAAEEAVNELDGKEITTTENVEVEGGDLQVENVELSASGGASDSAHATVSVDPGGTAEVDKEGDMEMVAKTSIPVIKGNGGGQTVKAPQATKTRDNSTPQKPGGGGGGGGKKTQKKKSKSDIKRYHEVDKSLEAYEHRINNLSKKEEMAFGADRVKLMAKRMQELNKEMDAYQEKLNEAAAYEKKDKANLEAAAAELGFTFEFDENGTITNWEQWQEKLIEWYNKHKDDEAEDGMESPEDIYKRLQQLSEDYEDSVKTRQEMEEKILEQLHKQSELYAEMIEESHKWKIDLQDLELTLLEGQLNRMDDTLGNMGEKAKLMAEALFGADGVGLDGVGMQKLDELQAKYNEIASAATDEESIKNGTGMDEATKAEKLQEVMKEINEQMNDLWAKGQEIQQLYGQMWEKYDQELQNNLKFLENNITMCGALVKVLELAGKSTAYDKLDEYYRKQLEYSNKQVDMYMSARDTIAAEKARFDEEIVAAGGFDNLDKQRQEDYKALLARIQETEANIVNATQGVLEAAAAVYQNAVNKAIDELDDTLSMGMGDLEYLQSQYDRYTEVQDRYLNTAHQLYNVNKLNRQIEGAMADTNSKALRDQYEQLQNVINEKAKSGKLTQYDVDMMQKQYELLEKQAALRDAENAKDTVRLTRDENGNYMYQYTADQDKVDEATQAYDDVLIQINELATQRVSELESEMLAKRKYYVEQARAIAEDETLTEEEKQERLTELRRQAAEDDLYFQEQMGIAYENLQINNSACVAHFGDAVDQAFNDPSEGINPTIQAAIENEENMATALGEAIDYIIPKLQELGRIQDQTLNRTGLEDPEEYFDTMAETTELAASETNKLNQTLATEAEQINAVTQEWYKQKQVLQDLFSTIEQANTENLQLLWKLGNNDSEASTPAPDGSIQYHLVPVRSSSAHSTDGGADGGTPTGYSTGGISRKTELAVLHGSTTDPELVLNADDTRNVLQAVAMAKLSDEEMVATAKKLQIALTGGGYGGNQDDKIDTLIHSGVVDQILQQIQGQAYAMSYGQLIPGGAPILGPQSGITQEIVINADFPNATDAEEIQKAFEELTNRAAQYVNNIRNK